MVGSGDFEICNSGTLVANGRVYTSNEQQKIHVESLEVSHVKYELNSDDLYKELRLRGYDFGPRFRGILRTSIAGMLFMLSKTNFALQKPSLDPQ